VIVDCNGLTKLWHCALEMSRSQSSWSCIAPMPLQYLERCTVAGRRCGSACLAQCSNIVAAQQSTKDRNLQDCNTIALSLEYMHHSCCSGENRSVIHSCHSWVDTSLCQRCEVVVLSSGMPTALCPLFKVPERSPTARPNQDFRANFFEDRQLLFDL
jgi:hypothetical protein